MTSGAVSPVGMDEYVIVKTSLVNTCSLSPSADYCFVQSTMFVRTLCILCGAPAESTADRLCRPCRAELPLPPAGACPGCGRSAVAATECARCFPRAPAFDSCLSGCTYRYPVDQMIKKLKYQARLDLVHALAQPLLQTAGRDMDVVPDSLLPTPLHPSRLRSRGFNQAGEIARVLSQRLSLPVDDQLVRRHRPTAQQYELRPEQRAKNVRGAFSLINTVGYKNIAIVDDILTTGATANELARLLKRHGAHHVQIWCLARAAPAG